VKKPILQSLSLWECLGVLTILGALTVALAPVVVRARTVAYDSSMSHWKSQVTALAMYVADYDQAPDFHRKLRTTMLAPLTTNAGCLVEDAKFSTAYNSLGDAVGCKDKTTGRIWALSAIIASNSQWSNTGATNYCNSLTTGGVPTGSWTLPTKDELQAVAANGSGSHFLQPNNQPDSQCVYNNWTRSKKGNGWYAVIQGDLNDAVDGVANGVECSTRTNVYGTLSYMDAHCVLKPGTPLP
jgi:hypothetical protein